MVIYKIDRKISVCGPDTEGLAGAALVEIYTPDEWDKSESRELLGYESFEKAAEKGISTLRMHSDYSVVVLGVPDKKKSERVNRMVCFVSARQLQIVDDGFLSLAVFAEIAEYKTFPNPSSGAVLCELLEQLIIDDVENLAHVEDDLDALEDDVLASKTDGFELRLMNMRKMLLARNRYYTMTADIIGELSENENCIFDRECPALFAALRARTERLEENARMIRDYAVQVREMYQSHIDLRQNSIMRILTVVTVIFMPPTLIAGWYGMNFKFMPELSWQWGYLGVAVLTAAVVGLLIWWLKRNKFW